MWVAIIVRVQVELSMPLLDWLARLELHDRRPCAVSPHGLRSSSPSGSTETDESLGCSRSQPFKSQDFCTRSGHHRIKSHFGYPRDFRASFTRWRGFLLSKYPDFFDVGCIQKTVAICSNRKSSTEGSNNASRTRRRASCPSKRKTTPFSRSRLARFCIK